MIDRTHDLPVVRQCEILALSRSSVYYLPRPVPPQDLALMRRIDELHLNFPFAGARMLRDLLRLEGFHVGRQRVARLMRQMGMEALYRKPNTSRRHPAHPVFPYLLRDLTITRPNHVWAMDITYIPMKRGFVYLAAVVDWATRRVLAWRLSISMTADFCIEAVEEAIARHGKPEIFNTDQGSQFTGTRLRRSAHRARHPDQHGQQRLLARQRLRRTALEEREVRRGLSARLRSVLEARKGLARYLAFYNTRRPHSSLDGQTPDTVYFKSLPLPRAA